MIPFSEHQRYEYDLTPDSVVIDVGGYEGNWAKTMYEKYGCTVIVLEPVPKFYEAIKQRFANCSGIHVLNVGLGDANREHPFGIQGDRTGRFNPSDDRVTVSIISPQTLLDSPYCNNRQIDVLKLNCEGAEFEILETILDQGLEHRFEALQAQPHSVVPDAVNRWAKIRERLLVSFEITSEDPNLDNGWLLMKRR